MVCTRSRSRIWADVLAILAVAFYFCRPVSSLAAVASQFSLSLGEVYSDNIFFSKEKEHDFVSLATPRLHLLYAPPGQVSPTGILSLSTSGELYARNSQLNNFGDNIDVNGGYSYQYSPRLSFNFLESFRLQGLTRLGEQGGLGQFQSGPTVPPVINTPSPEQRLQDLISRGEQLSNTVGFHSSFLLRPDLSIGGGYRNSYTKFLDAGGSDVFHTAETRAVYNWRIDHNLHAGYSISISDSRNGESGVIHSFDVGDDYFTNYNIQLTPTLSVSAGTGVSLNTGNDGPRVANNTSVTVTKLWETAALNAGLRKGLTPSFGVSGISDTTALFTTLNFQLSEKLSTSTNAVFSLFDTDDVDFKTFQAGVGVQYAFNSWLSSGLNYYFNWRDAGAGVNSTDGFLEKGIVKSNSVSVNVTIRFDVWPNVGLAKGISPNLLIPAIRTPFSSLPSGSPPTTTSPTRNP